MAGAALAVAVLRRWTLWSAWTPAIVLLAGAAGLAAYILIATRARSLADRAAAAIDRDAGLGGELRSASWFAGREARDNWANLHLERAAARLKSVDWAQLYPAVRAPRARLASVVMIAAALALTFGLPQRASARRPAADSPTPAPAARPADVRPDALALLLPPELLKQLEALLAAAQAGDARKAEALANSAELRELLDKLAADPELLAKLAKALAAADPTKAPTAKELKALAERARRAAAMDELSEDMRDVLEKMAEEADDAQESASDDDGEEMTSGGPQKGDSAKSNAASSMQELSVQLARQADPGGGAGIMMMANPADQGSGPPGSGVGGSGSEEAAAAAAAALAAAFKQEVVEASQDNPGDNIDTEIRRKTEQGSSKMEFTHSASAQFDKSRAAAPPPVPEARRSGVQSYFVRKPQ